MAWQVANRLDSPTVTSVPGRQGALGRGYLAPSHEWRFHGTRGSWTLNSTCDSAQSGRFNSTINSLTAAEACARSYRQYQDLLDLHDNPHTHAPVQRSEALETPIRKPTAITLSSHRNGGREIQHRLKRREKKTAQKRGGRILIPYGNDRVRSYPSLYNLIRKIQPAGRLAGMV